MKAPMDLEDLLREQASRARLTPLSVASVSARARRIRRRRTAGAVAGAVAAVTVVVGGSAVLLDGGRPGATPPIAHSPSSVASPSAAARTGRVVRVEPSAHHDVEQTFNDALRVPSWADGQLVAPDGTHAPLAQRPFAFAYDPVARQWAVTASATDGTHVMLLDQQGQEIEAPAPSVPSGVAYSHATGLVRIAGTNGRWTLVTPARTFDLGRDGTEISIDGFDDNGDVLLTVGRRPKVAHLADGSVEAASRQTIYPSADGLYAALIGDPDHDVPGSEEWDADGATGTIRVAQAGTLQTLVAFLAPRNGFFGPWTWDGDSIVTLVFERAAPTSPTGTWTLVRLGAEGYQVGRSARWPGRIDAPPYLFETRASSGGTGTP
jgi:hypothetical protein